MSRSTMIARVRAALSPQRGATAARAQAVAERLAHPPRHPRPAFARLAEEEREARFTACLEGQGATVMRVAGRADIPAAIEQLLGGTPPGSSPRAGEEQGRVGDAPPMTCGGKWRFVIGDDERLAALPWPDTIAPARWSPDQTLGDGTAALTHAWGAAAETGTLVLTSGAANPALLAFLPELHIVALARADLAAAFEDAFARLGAAIAPGRFPRAVNLVSSPSRTSDIGGLSVRGAHGPRRLAVILYG